MAVVRLDGWALARPARRREFRAADARGGAAAGRLAGVAGRRRTSGPRARGGPALEASARRSRRHPAKRGKLGFALVPVAVF